MFRRQWIAFGMLFCLLGCASYLKRKECERTDWYEYGKQKAFAGTYLSDDKLIRECVEADGKTDDGAADRGFKAGREIFCTPDHAYQMGRIGNFYKPDICDGVNPKKLLDRHSAGVKDYCRKDNGYSAGQKGNSYNQICPKELEKNFVPEFNRGRKVWLTVQIGQKEMEIVALDKEVNDLNAEKNHVQAQINSLSNSKKMVKESHVDVASGKTIEETRWVDDDGVFSERINLNNNMSRLDQNISQKRDEQRQARSKIRDMQTELAGL